MKEILRKMKHEIITLDGVQIIGMAKEIAFCKGQEECPKFWGEYVERIIKPVFMEHKMPDAFQQAAIDNGVGEFGLCFFSYSDKIQHFIIAYFTLKPQVYFLVLTFHIIRCQAQKIRICVDVRQFP